MHHNEGLLYIYIYICRCITYIDLYTYIYIYTHIYVYITLTISRFQTWILPFSSTNTLDIIVSRKDGYDNGYTTGNAITYKFFDKSIINPVERNSRIFIFKKYSGSKFRWITILPIFTERALK